MLIALNGKEIGKFSHGSEKSEEAETKHETILAVEKHGSVDYVQEENRFVAPRKGRGHVLEKCQDEFDPHLFVKKIGAHQLLWKKKIRII